MNQPSHRPPTQRDLDPHLRRYAQRTVGMTASEIRALFAVASRPEVVSLAGGMPYLPALPLDSLADELAQMLALMRAIGATRRQIKRSLRLDGRVPSLRLRRHRRQVPQLREIGRTMFPRLLEPPSRRRSCLLLPLVRRRDR